MTLEKKARGSIDVLLVEAGLHVCNVSGANVQRTQALRHAPLPRSFVVGSGQI